MRRVIALVFIAVFMMNMVVCNFYNQTGNNNVDTVYNKFTEIPGITQDEIDSINKLRMNEKEFILGMPLSDECFFTENNELGGYTVLLCNLLSKLFEIKFTPRIYKYDSLHQKINDKSLDFTGDMTTSESNKNRYFMTDAIAQRNIVEISLHDQSKLNDIINNGTVRIVMLDKTSITENVSKFLEFDYELIIVPTYEDAKEKLLNGEADMMIDDSGAQVYFDGMSNVTIKNLSPVRYRLVSLATMNPNLKPIITVFNRYLKSESVNELTRLYSEGKRNYIRDKLYRQFTVDERKYISVHQSPAAIIPVAIECDNYPLCFYNENEEQWQGISVDVLTEITNLTGMKFSFISSKNAIWADVMQSLVDGEAAIITELIRTPEREDKFLWADTAYIEDKYALLSRSDMADINVSQIANMRVGVLRDAAYTEAFKEMFPNHEKSVSYDTIMEAFDALEKGDIDLIMATRNHLLSVTNYMERAGFKANLVLDRTFESSFGFNKKQAILASVVSKTLTFVDTDSISDKWIRRVFDYRGKMARELVPYLVGASILLIIVLALICVLLIRHRQSGRELEATVNERTKELQLRSKELEIQTNAAQVASKAKSEFLARMSHEIRTPLNAIIGMTEIAKRAEEHRKQIDSLEEIDAASNHLLGILNDVLDMSKIESGKFLLADENFILKTAMDEVAKIIYQRCEEKNITFNTTIDHLPECGVIGDKLRLKQVLINLLGNAVKFTDDGGRVDFEVVIKDETKDYITAEFIINDNGIGMSGEQISKLFVAFEQADSSISVRFGGTGLGLAISQSLVNLMKGNIEVESELNKGSKFTFTLKLDKQEMIEIQPEVSEKSLLDFRGKHILLVEDIDINRMIITELLGETKVEIDEAEDGLDAIDKFSKSPENYYSLIFMDIQMPNMGGYEATEKIRKLIRSDAVSVPIIAMTANAYKEDIDKALKSGMNGHISKPIDIEIVLKTLSHYLK